MAVPEMSNITKSRESILNTYLAKVSLRKVSIKSISHMIGLYPCCSQMYLKTFSYI